MSPGATAPEGSEFAILLGIRGVVEVSVTGPQWPIDHPPTVIRGHDTGLGLVAAPCVQVLTARQHAVNAGSEALNGFAPASGPVEASNHVHHGGSKPIVQHAHITLVDDIDGSEASETVSFMLDGVEYVIDLNDEHATDLREELHRYIEVARRTGGRAVRRHVANAGTRVTGIVQQSESAQIREWAAARGVPVNPQGRIAQDVIDAYHAAMAPPVRGARRRGGRTSAGA